MTPIANMVERMLAAGTAHDVIVLAIRTAESVTPVTTRRDAVSVPSRSREAERAARYRENIKNRNALAKANDVAKTGAEMRDGERDASRRVVTDAPTLLVSSSLNAEGLSEQGSKKKKKEQPENARARGTRMQAGAVLTDKFRQAALDLGAPAHVIDEMWAEHVDYWVGVPGERGVKTEPNGWLATWRNDVRRKLKMGTYNGQRSNHAPGRSGADDFFAGLKEVAADLDRDGAVARSATSDIPRGRVEIDGSGTPGGDARAGAHAGFDFDRR